jgi:hypothetical protein
MPEIAHTGRGPESDSAELARRYQEKQRLLESQGIEREAREVFREVTKEHSESVMPRSTSLDVSKPDTGSLATHTDLADKEKLDQLVEVALEKGMTPAIAKAVVESPYLIDALHDELADHYFEKLVASGALEAEK